MQRREIGLDPVNLDSLSSDIDEWIPRNERALRDDQCSDWTRGLVKWSLHSNAVFLIPLFLQHPACLGKNPWRNLTGPAYSLPVVLSSPPSPASALITSTDTVPRRLTYIYLWPGSQTSQPQGRTCFPHLEIEFIARCEGQDPPRAEFPHYHVPIKRVQIVMKLVKSPKHVFIECRLGRVFHGMGWPAKIRQSACTPGEEIWS